MVKKLNVMNDYELFVGVAAPNTYNLAPPLYICMGVVPVHYLVFFAKQKKKKKKKKRNILSSDLNWKNQQLSSYIAAAGITKIHLHSANMVTTHARLPSHSY